MFLSLENNALLLGLIDLECDHFQAGGIIFQQPRSYNGKCGRMQWHIHELHLNSWQQYECHLWKESSRQRSHCAEPGVESLWYWRWDQLLIKGKWWLVTCDSASGVNFPWNEQRHVYCCHLSIFLLLPFFPS